MTRTKIWTVALAGLLTVAACGGEGEAGDEVGSGGTEGSTGTLETTNGGMGTAGDTAAGSPAPLTTDPSTTTQVDTPGANGVAAGH